MQIIELYLVYYCILMKLSYFPLKIAHYKIPKYIVFTKEFPKTTSGKVQKFRMREDTIKQFQIKDITHLKYATET